MPILLRTIRFLLECFLRSNVPIVTQCTLGQLPTPLLVPSSPVVLLSPACERVRNIPGQEVADVITSESSYTRMLALNGPHPPVRNHHVATEVFVPKLMTVCEASKRFGWKYKRLPQRKEGRNARSSAPISQVPCRSKIVPMPKRHPV